MIINSESNLFTKNNLLKISKSNSFLISKLIKSSFNIILKLNVFVFGNSNFIVNENCPLLFSILFFNFIKILLSLKYNNPGIISIPNNSFHFIFILISLFIKNESISSQSTYSKSLSNSSTFFVSKLNLVNEYPNN